MPQILIIRPQPGADETAHAVRALGCVPLVAPVITLQPTATPQPPGPFAAIAVTSAEAVRQLAARGINKHIKLFTVGAGSSQVARQLGFTDVTAAAGTSHDLAKLLENELPPGSAVLYPHGDPISRDIAHLVPGLIILPWLVYRQEPVAALDPVAVAAIAAGQVATVLAYSAFQAEVFAKLTAQVPGIANLSAAVMSQRAVSPLARLGMRIIQIAPAPDEASLLALIKG